VQFRADQARPGAHKPRNSGITDTLNDRTDFPHLAVVLAVMIAISMVLLRWAKRQGWW
jgi:hypothetical protein